MSNALRLHDVSPLWFALLRITPLVWDTLHLHQLALCRSQGLQADSRFVEVTETNWAGRRHRATSTGSIHRLAASVVNPPFIHNSDFCTERSFEDATGQAAFADAGCLRESVEARK
jgi:hypothetical protein